jgi:hypothetical protein
MTRILLSTLLLTIWTVSLSSADIFKCQQPDGTIVFTDNSSAADCKLERVDLPPLSIMSDTSLSLGSTPGDSGPGPAYSGEKSAKTYEEFKSEVSLLVEQFTSARRGAMRGLVVNKQKARRDLTDIRAQENELASEIERSELSRSEKQELQGSLATITE